MRLNVADRGVPGVKHRPIDLTVHMYKAVLLVDAVLALKLKNNIYFAWNIFVKENGQTDGGTGRLENAVRHKRQNSY